MLREIRSRIWWLLNFPMFTTLLDVLPIAIGIYDPRNFTYVWVNKHYQKLTGYSFEELTEHPITDYINESSIEVTVKEIEAVKDPSVVGRHRHFVNQWNTKNGNVITKSYLSAQLGDYIGTVVTITDND